MSIRSAKIWRERRAFKKRGDHLMAPYTALYDKIMKSRIAKYLYYELPKSEKAACKN